MATVGQVAVIVAQEGADASTSMEMLRVDAPSVVLLHQEPGESLGQLSHRVRARLSALVTSGYRVHSATFVAKNGFGLLDVPATADLLRALVASMVSAGAGRVYLHAHTRDTRANYALAALADAIADQVRGTGVEIVTGPRAHQSARELANAVA